MRETLLDGAKSLLGECCYILNQNNIEYLIVGGWAPFLYNSNGYLHPGTKDVDILFKRGFEENQLKEIIEIFLSKGFFQSAKHSFQLLKEIEINGYNFIYNVDLLHPDNQEKKPEMYVDHINFPIKESIYISVNYKGKTILLPKSDSFFTDFSDKYTDSFHLLNDETAEITFDLLDEAGIILSKLESAFIAKRDRDAYDIYLALKYNRDYESTILKLKKIIAENLSVKNLFEKFLKKESIVYLDDKVTDWTAKMNNYNPNFSSIEVFEKLKIDLVL